MKGIISISALFLAAGCASVQKAEQHRFPASSGAPFQAMVCRSGAAGASAVKYNRQAKNMATPEQLDEISRYVTLLPTHVRLTELKGNYPKPAGCGCESIAVRSDNGSFLVDGSLFNLLNPEQQLALKSDLIAVARGSGPSMQAVTTQCEGYISRKK